jgi:hypothetical protein
VASAGASALTVTGVPAPARCRRSRR